MTEEPRGEDHGRTGELLNPVVYLVIGLEPELACNGDVVEVDDQEARERRGAEHGEKRSDVSQPGTLRSYKADKREDERRPHDEGKVKAGRAQLCHSGLSAYSWARS